jgi:amino acid permease
MATSIMLAGLTGHVGLPPMFAEMKKPSDFNKTLYGSFALMFLIYLFVGVCGYLLFGGAASMLITTDMSAATHGVGGRVLVRLVLAAITFKLFCSVPMWVVVMVDIAQNLCAVP